MRKPVSDRERIDAEPKPPRQPMLRIGTKVWFIDSGSRWFLLEVVERRGTRATFKSVTGWDAERQVEWPYQGLLEFPQASSLYKRLRPLSARRP